MKKSLCLAVVLLVLIAPLALAQRFEPRNQVRGGRIQLSISATKAEFKFDESVEFVLRTADFPARLQGSFYTIEKQLADGGWQEFYRSPEDPLEQKFLAQNSELVFSWSRMNTDGSRAADQGQWRIKFVPFPAAAETPLIANFVLKPGGQAQGQGALEVKCMRNKLVLGETVTFRLENVGVGRADLEGCYFVIERWKNNRWLEWMTSPRNPFDFRGLNAGEVRKWDWHQDDGRGHRTEKGDWRIVFYAPRVPRTPVAHQFLIF